MEKLLALVLVGLTGLSRRWARNVSIPEGARVGGRRIDRVPSWTNREGGGARDFLAEGSEAGGEWVCVTCEESHKKTREKFGEEGIISGESLGRCTWWFVETDNERIIHPGVHRGITGNVNSSDIVYRSQVLR